MELNWQRLEFFEFGYDAPLWCLQLISRFEIKANSWKIGRNSRNFFCLPQYVLLLCHVIAFRVGKIDHFNLFLAAKYDFCPKSHVLYRRCPFRDLIAKSDQLNVVAICHVNITSVNRRTINAIKMVILCHFPTLDKWPQIIRRVYVDYVTSCNNDRLHSVEKKKKKLDVGMDHWWLSCLTCKNVRYIGYFRSQSIP